MKLMRILSSRLRVSVPPVLEALMLTGNVPLCVGVPEIKPGELLTVRPSGRPVAPYEAGF